MSSRERACRAPPRMRARTPDSGEQHAREIEESEDQPTIQDRKKCTIKRCRRRTRERSLVMMSRPGSRPRARRDSTVESVTEVLSLAAIVRRGIPATGYREQAALDARTTRSNCPSALVDQKKARIAEVHGEKTSRHVASGRRSSPQPSDAAQSQPSLTPTHRPGLRSPVGRSRQAPRRRRRRGEVIDLRRRAASVATREIAPTPIHVIPETARDIPQPERSPAPPIRAGCTHSANEGASVPARPQPATFARTRTR